MDTEEMASRIRMALSGEDAISERRMFGGVAFMKHGHMVCGASGTGDLMLRVGKPGYAEALAHPDTRAMDFTGRVMTGYVYVDPAAVQTSEAMSRWIAKAVAFVDTLPPKGG